MTLLVCLGIYAAVAGIVYGYCEEVGAPKEHCIVWPLLPFVVIGILIGQMYRKWYQAKYIADQEAAQKDGAR